MTLTTLNKSREINSFLATMNDADKTVPLRQLNTGFDLYASCYKEYRSMTASEFLEKVASYNFINKGVRRLADTVMSLLSDNCYQRPSAIAPAPTTKYVHRPRVLPKTADVPFFEQAAEVIETLLNAMSASSPKNQKAAARLSLGFSNVLTVDQIAAIESCTRERIRQVRTKFQADLMNGILPKELKRDYAISDSFISLAKATVHSIANRDIESVRHQFGNLSESKIKFILEMLDLKLRAVAGKKFVLAKAEFHAFEGLADQVRMQLKKEFDFGPLSDLLPDDKRSVSAFIHHYLESMPEAYEFNGDGGAVRMIGKGLQKAVRQARIIFEAEKSVSIEEISRRYEELYGEEMGGIRSNDLRKMGFAPIDKTTRWRFGESPVKANKIIRNIITPERPITTFNTIVKALEKEGYEYPLSTIRSYITAVATPENKQHDLFCLKGYCHLFPNYSWRKYRKIPA